MNTDDSDMKGTRWWSIPEIEPKTDIFFFDTFGADRLKSFIIEDDRKVIEKNTIWYRKNDKGRQ